MTRLTLSLLPSVSAKFLCRLSLLSLALFVLVLLDISLGSVSIPFTSTFKILLGYPVENEVWEAIIFKIRLPRALTAILVGTSLALSGLQMQTLFQNPLAGPGILGITAGASLGVAFVILLSGSLISQSVLKTLHSSGLGVLVLASILGASLVMIIILALAWKVRDPVVLLILGLMIGNLSIALVSIGQYFSRPGEIQSFLLWSFGSLGGLSPHQLFWFTLLVLGGILCSIPLNRSLNVLLLGEEYALSMGVPVLRLRLYLILITGVLAGSVTAFCGPIAFIGVSVPHLARALYRGADHRYLSPLVILSGAALMLICDLIAKLPGQSSVLPINAVTSLIGSPIIIFVILKNRNLKRAF